MPKFDPQYFLKTLTTHPGVYQMLDVEGKTLYVGKAKNLKKRVSSYFKSSLNSAKTYSLVKQIANIQVTITSSENEALLLESTLIKELTPRYNILLRDDKSFPYIYLSNEEYPRLGFHRGTKRKAGRYFGPYPSSGAVRKTISLLEKIFMIRNCDETYFNSRSRACLQYQIRRCTAPCVGYISKQDYLDNVKNATLFLEGKSDEVIQQLVKKMEHAAEELAFDKAALYRDQIASLRQVHAQQYVSDQGEVNIDIMVIAEKLHSFCIHVLTIRNGHLLGGHNYFPAIPAGSTQEEILAEFLPQYYLKQFPGEILPERIIINLHLSEKNWLQSALSEQLNKKIIITNKVRTKAQHWLAIASTNAEQALSARLAEKQLLSARSQALQKILNLAKPPERLECFDVSHTAGEATVVSCVTFIKAAPANREYRYFNIEGITAGDDYAALAQALTRRYMRVKKGEIKTPDILIIDGGKGQLTRAESVLQELGIDKVQLLSVVKGEGRKADLDRVIVGSTHEILTIPADSPALHLLQHIRNEAHRFAITGHRKRRAKARSQSILETIPGIGPKRRQQLLKQFGGIKELERVSIEELAKVSGMSLELAKVLYKALHE